MQAAEEKTLDTIMQTAEEKTLDKIMQTAEEKTLDTIIQIAEEKLIDLITQTAEGKALDVSPQTAENETLDASPLYDSPLVIDLSGDEQFPATPESSKESKKRKISKVQETTHDSDAGKLLRTEAFRMGDEFDCSLNVPPVDSGNTSYINTQENVASYMTISQEENAPFRKSETDVSKGENVFSVGDMLDVPGQFHCLEKNSSVEKIQKRSICLVCKLTSSIHEKGPNANYIFRCCRCEFASESFNYLQIHVYNEHTKRYYCPVCQMNISELKTHEIFGGTCELCERDTYFKCKFQLEEHYISEHKEFLKTNCMICKRKLYEHLTAEVVVEDKYQCCVKDCKKRFNYKSKLVEHIVFHSYLRLQKCDICEGHFKLISDHKSKNHPFCQSCGKRFVNIYFLNEHHCEKRKEKEFLI